MFINTNPLKVEMHALKKSATEKSLNKLIYFNRPFDKNRLKTLINWSLTYFGEKKTIDLIELLKTLGYSYATKAGISLSIDDLKIPSLKNQLLVDAETKLKFTNQDVKKGYLTSIEYFAQVIDTWNTTSEIIKKEVIDNFKKTDVLNPVYMMSFSGARGNLSQVRQLVGMRGLMADPSGRIIDFPIQSNFREGLTLTEYIISCYGARKGVVDTALRTATSGYLTRRLVDVAQHVIVRLYDCGTERGIYVSDLKMGTKTLLSLKNRLKGRVLAETIYDTQDSKKVIAYKNQEITPKLAQFLINNSKPILIRSPLTCQDKNYVCQLCYGWNLSHNRLVPLGEAVGIIAAQSIGEPGTQLTMRTFHTGGVFSGDVSEQIYAPFEGFISFSNSIPGKLVRTTHGQIAFLTKQNSFLFITPIANQRVDQSFLNKHELNKSVNSQKRMSKKLIIPAYCLLFVKQNQKVKAFQLLAEVSSFLNNENQSVDVFQTVYSELSGEINFKQSIGVQTITEHNNPFNLTNLNMGEFWILSAQKQSILKPINVFIKSGDFVKTNSFIYSYSVLSNVFNAFQNSFLVKHRLKEQQNLQSVGRFKNPVEMNRFIKPFFNTLFSEKVRLNTCFSSNKTRFQKANYFYITNSHLTKNYLLSKRFHCDSFIYETKSKTNHLNLYQSKLQKLSFNTNNFQCSCNIIKKTYFLKKVQVKHSSYGLTQVVHFKQKLNRKMGLFEKQITYYLVPLNDFNCFQKQKRANKLKKAQNQKLFIAQKQGDNANTKSKHWIKHKNGLKQTAFSYFTTYKKSSLNTLMFNAQKVRMSKFKTVNIPKVVLKKLTTHKLYNGFLNNTFTISNNSYFNDFDLRFNEINKLKKQKVGFFDVNKKASFQQNSFSFSNQELKQKDFLKCYLNQLKKVYYYHFRFQKVSNTFFSVLNQNSSLFLENSLIQKSVDSFFDQFSVNNLHLIKKDISFLKKSHFAYFNNIHFQKKKRLIVFQKQNKSFQLLNQHYKKKLVTPFIDNSTYLSLKTKKKKNNITFKKKTLLLILSHFISSNQTSFSRSFFQYNLFIWNLIFEKKIQHIFLWFFILKKLKFNQNKKRNYFGHFLFQNKVQKIRHWKLLSFSSSSSQNQPFFYFLDQKEYLRFSICNIWLSRQINQQNSHVICFEHHLNFCKNRKGTKDHYKKPNTFFRSTFLAANKPFYLKTYSRFIGLNLQTLIQSKLFKIQAPISSTLLLTANSPNQKKHSVNFGLNTLTRFSKTHLFSILPLLPLTQLPLLLPQGQKQRKQRKQGKQVDVQKQNAKSNNKKLFHLKNNQHQIKNRFNSAIKFYNLTKNIISLNKPFAFSLTKKRVPLQSLFYFSQCNLFSKPYFNFNYSVYLKNKFTNIQQNVNNSFDAFEPTIHNNSFPFILDDHYLFFLCSFFIPCLDYKKTLFRFYFSSLSQVELNSQLSNRYVSQIKRILKTSRFDIMTIKTSNLNNQHLKIRQKQTRFQIPKLKKDQIKSQFFLWKKKNNKFKKRFQNKWHYGLNKKFKLNSSFFNASSKNTLVKSCFKTPNQPTTYFKINLNLIFNTITNEISSKFQNQVIHYLLVHFLLKTNHLFLSFVFTKCQTLSFVQTQLTFENSKLICSQFGTNKKMSYDHFDDDIIINQHWFCLLSNNKKEFKNHNKMLSPGHLIVKSILFDNHIILSKFFFNFKTSIFFNFYDIWVFCLKHLSNKNEIDLINKHQLKKPFISYASFFFHNYFQELILNSNQLFFIDQEIKNQIHFNKGFNTTLKKGILVNKKRTKMPFLYRNENQKPSFIVQLFLNFYFKAVFINLKKANSNLRLINGHKVQLKKLKLKTIQAYVRQVLLKTATFPKKQIKYNSKTKLTQSYFLTFNPFFIQNRSLNKKVKINKRNRLFLIKTANVFFNFNTRYQPKLLIQQIKYDEKIKTSQTQVLTDNSNVIFLKIFYSNYTLAVFRKSQEIGIQKTVALPNTFLLESKCRLTKIKSLRNQILKTKMLNHELTNPVVFSTQINQKKQAKNPEKSNLKFVTSQKQWLPKYNFSIIQSKRFQLKTIDLIKSKLKLINYAKQKKVLSFYQQASRLCDNNRKTRNQLNFYSSILDFNLFEQNKNFNILSLPSYSKSFYCTQQHYFFLNNLNYVFHFHFYFEKDHKIINDFYLKTHVKTSIFKMKEHVFKTQCLKTKINLLSTNYFNGNQQKKIYELSKASEDIKQKGQHKREWVQKAQLLKTDVSRFSGDVLSISQTNLPNNRLKSTNFKKDFKNIYYLTDSDIITYKLKTKLLQNFFLGDFLDSGKMINNELAISQPGQLLFINEKKVILRKAKVYLLSSGAICNLKQGTFVNSQTPLLTLTYKNLKTEDIVQGIPKIEQLFEARENLTEQSSLNQLIKMKFQTYKKKFSRKDAVRKSIAFIQQYIVNAIQNVYQSQGINISDKHIEIIVKQMTSKVRITEVGNTGLLRDDIVYLDWVELINAGLKGQKAEYEPLVLGITKASLEIDGFISAASFQETIKILTQAAILQKRDFLRGLKENLILGHLLPAGTGFDLPS